MVTLDSVFVPSQFVPKCQNFDAEIYLSVPKKFKLIQSILAVVEIGFRLPKNKITMENVFVPIHFVQEWPNQRSKIHLDLF